MVTNYTEWKAAVTAEHKKLAEVSHYLNDEGKERLRVFDTLGDLACFCETPEDLIAWIEKKDGLDTNDVSAVNSEHASGAIRALKNIIKT